MAEQIKAKQSNNTRSKKLLTCKQEIMDYLDCSKDRFKKYIEAGMPALYEDGRWTAHTDNLDEFFKRYTFVTMKNKINIIPDDD